MNPSIILKAFLTILFLNITFQVSAQENKKEASKIAQFASKTGVIVKFEDYNLSDIKLKYGKAESKIRKIISGNEIQYFHQISYKRESSTTTTSIAIEDLLELLKAVKALKEMSTNESGTTSDYLENKFITEDDVELGYYLLNKKLVWYLVLKNYGSGNTLFFKDISSIEQSLNEAKSKIESLKSK